MTLAEMEAVIAEARRLESIVDVLAAWLLDAHERIERLEDRIEERAGASIDRELLPTSVAVAEKLRARRKDGPLRTDPALAERWARIRF